MRPFRFGALGETLSRRNDLAGTVCRAEDAGCPTFIISDAELAAASPVIAMLAGR